MNAHNEGERLKFLRELAGLSQAEFAKVVRDRGPKWSQGTVWTVEAGERPLRLSEAILIAEFLGLSLDEAWGSGEASSGAELVRMRALVRQIAELVR